MPFEIHRPEPDETDKPLSTPEAQYPEGGKSLADAIGKAYRESQPPIIPPEYGQRFGVSGTPNGQRDARIIAALEGLCVQMAGMREACERTAESMSELARFAEQRATGVERKIR